MTYYLPLSPYHNNLSVYWQTTDRGQTENFWTWVEQEYKTKLALQKRPERWKFESEQDMIWFMLRWS